MTTHVKAVRAGDMPPDELVLAGSVLKDKVNIAKCKQGKDYRASLKLEKVRKFHNLVFATLGAHYENQDIQSKDVFRTGVKLAIGWVYDDPIIDENGTHYVVKPLDDQNCSQAELETFWALYKPCAAEVLGWDYITAHEGGL